MSYYVEMLRAKRAMIINAILIALFLITALIVRLSIGITDPQSWKHNAMSSPTAHVAVSTTPDGWTKTVIDDPQQRLHATILEQGRRISIDATMPASHREQIDVIAGDSSRSVSIENGMRHMKVRADVRPPHIYLSILLLASLPTGLFIATLLGGVLSKENDGHLELAWTKPVSREAYALAAFAVDACAILIMEAVCVLVELGAMLFFFVPNVVFDSNVGFALALAIVGPFAWYAVLNAASASIKRGPGLVIGLGWAAALVLPGVAHGLGVLAPYNAVANAFYQVFNALAYLDPIRYLSFGWHGDSMTSTSGFSLEGAALILAGLTVAYLAVAVAQWRRVEA